MPEPPEPAEVIPRGDGRSANALRPVELVPGWLSQPAGSALVKQGRTWVSCTVVTEARVPVWRRGSGRGWLTASYGLLPGATSERSERERRGPGGRTHEIERLIGRSLRSAVDLAVVPDTTLHVDCDVLQADGGTRAAAITGGWLALALAVKKLADEGKLRREVLRDQIAAVGVGMADGIPLLDLDYAEDLHADTDMTVAMAADGRFIEVQGTAEGRPFSASDLVAMVELAAAGASHLLALQREALDVA